MAAFPNTLDTLLGLPQLEVNGSDDDDLPRRERIRITGDLVSASDNDTDGDEATELVIADPGTGTWKLPVVAAFTTNLDGITALFAAGATLTEDGNGALGAADGVTLEIGDSVLLFVQTDETQNGLYVVEDLGSVSTPWVLRRRSDAKSSAQFSSGATVVVTGGSTYEKRHFTLEIASPFTLDTTAQVWSFSDPTGTVTAPADPADDGKIALADSGDLVYLGAASAGNLLRWNGSTWGGQTIDLENPNTAETGTANQVLQTNAAGNANEWRDDLTVPGQLAWGSVGQTYKAQLQTTNATPTRTPLLFTAPNDTKFIVVIVVIAHQVATGDTRILEIKRKAKVIGGTLTALSASTIVSDDGDAGGSTWTATVDFSGTGNRNVAVMCTGEAAHTIEWQAVAQQIYRLI